MVEIIEESKATEVTELESDVTLTNKRNESHCENLNKILAFNTAYYVFVFIIIGVPIWFLTTSTYRSSLPFDKIDEISKKNLFNLQLNFEFISNLNDVKIFENKFLDSLKQDNSKNNGLILNYKFLSRSLNENELNLVLKSKKIEELDNELTSDLNTLRIYILDKSIADKFKINDKNFILMNNLYVSEDNMKDLTKIVEFIDRNFLRVGQLEDNINSKANVKRKLPTKDDLKVVNFDSNYEITFSLINSNPKSYSKWNIEYCVDKYFQKIANQLRPFTNFTIKAQTLLYSDFDKHSFSVTRDENTNEPYFFIRQRDLSFMTNHIENRLGSRISDSSALEFVVYVPPKEPLYIKPESKESSSFKLSAFLVPRWGGIYIQNSFDKSESLKVDEAVKTFLTQFIHLVGINLNQNQGVIRSQIYSTEIHSYLLKNTLNNLLTSINTLKSLSSLLTRIQEMVIEDEIAEQVYMSIEAVQKCLEFLENGNIEKAFFESKTAFLTSEKAFFDKSLLGQLYFPEDQRFAIYIPLFVPVGIPLALSIKMIFTKLFKKSSIDQKPKSD